MYTFRGMRASDRAYAALREDIMDGALSPGTTLTENDQSERLGVSRTPVREALSRLVADGLAVQTKGRGTVVSDISLADVDRLFEVRLPLEIQASRLAATRGAEESVHARFAALADAFDTAFDTAFDSAGASPSGDSLSGAAETASHGSDTAKYYRLAESMDAAIDETVDNSYLTHMLVGLRLHLRRIRRLSHDDPTRLAASAAEHREICSAIATGDPAMAAAATELHLRRSLHHISGSSQESPGTRATEDHITP